MSSVRVRTHQRLVLWWRSIEWDRGLEAFEGDDFLRPGLVPFAGDGYGSSYCFALALESPYDEDGTDNQRLWEH